MVRAMEYYARRNDNVPFESFVSATVSEVRPWRTETILPLGRSTDFEAGVCVTSAKSQANLENPANRCTSSTTAGIPDSLRIRTPDATPINPLRRRVPRLPVNEPGFVLHPLCPFEIIN